MTCCILIGAGGHAKVLLDIMLLSSETVEGVIDPNLDKTGIKSWRGLKVLGSDEQIKHFSPANYILVNGLGSLPSSSNRKDIYLKFKKMGFSFKNLTHPSAIVSPSATILEGVQIMAGCIIQADTKLGENAIINTRSSIDHDCVIGAHSHIAPGATISGGVKVGESCHIGTGASIIQGVDIGDAAILAAGACLYTDLEKGGKQFGAKLPATVFN